MLARVAADVRHYNPPDGGALTTHADWQRRCDEHQREIGRFLADAERLDDAAWVLSPAAGKWCPGQVAEHLVLSYAAMRRELAGGVGLRLRTVSGGACSSAGASCP